MKLITAVFEKEGRDYGTMLENLKTSALKLAYDLQVYSLPKDPMQRWEGRGLYFSPCFFKPEIIKNFLENNSEDVLWVDCDCLLKARVDEILDEVDMAVTLRRKTTGDIFDGFLNAGVMAFRNNLHSKLFLSAWIRELPNGRADQDAINRLLLKRSGLDKYGEVVDIDGIKIKVVDCDTYNFFYFPEKNSAKIYHVKGHLRNEFYNVCAKEVLGEKAKLLEG